jgi:hypothetical protein
VVTDDIIFEDLKNLSGGMIVIDKEMKLSDSRDILAKTKKKRPQGKK